VDTSDAALHCQEVAAFASVFLGRAPGVVWPEHDHPAYDPHADEADRVLLARGLADLMGRPVQTARSEEAPLSVRAARASRDTLVHQISGSGHWTLLPDPAEHSGGEGELPAKAAISYQLRSREILYIPPGYSWVIQPVIQPSAYLFSFIGDPPPATGHTAQ
jgi:hypothetical protein